MHCKYCGRAGCCQPEEEAPSIQVYFHKEGFISGQATGFRSGSEPCDYKDLENVANAIDRLVQFLTNGQPSYVHFRY